MKIAALLSRKKGRDFYDVLFLLSQVNPDFDFLSKKCNIHNMEGLKASFKLMLEKTDLRNKSNDFKHMVFDQRNSERILYFKEFIEEL